MTRQYSQYEITEQATILCLAELNKQVSYAMLYQIKPALVMLEEMYMGKLMAFTATAVGMMEGAKAQKDNSGKEGASQESDGGKFGTVEESSGEVRYTMPHNENIHRAINLPQI
jgi:hypothetical protein